MDRNSRLFGEGDGCRLPGHAGVTRFQVRAWNMEHARAVRGRQLPWHRWMADLGDRRCTDASSYNYNIRYTHVSWKNSTVEGALRIRSLLFSWPMPLSTWPRHYPQLNFLPIGLLDCHFTRPGVARIQRSRRCSCQNRIPRGLLAYREAVVELKFTKLHVGSPSGLLEQLLFESQRKLSLGFLAAYQANGYMTTRFSLLRRAERNS